MASDNLLQEFLPVSTEAWEAAIARDLRGADYKKKLIWQTEEGMAVKPYYRSEDVAALQLRELAPGDFPYLRSSRTTGDWRIREEIEEADPETANQAARSAVAAGAEEIAFVAVAVKNVSDLGSLLAGLQGVPVHLQVAGEMLLHILIERFKERNEAHSISTGWNPLTNVDLAAEFIRSAPSALVPFTLDGIEMEEAGGTAVEEISLVLAAGIDYLAEMTTRDVGIDSASASVAFSFAIGANYFFQIAKFRAFRMLWARAVESFGGSTESAKALIHARTSRWNKTIYDPYVNVLRSTTEAMSAALGGVDSITVAPFDECYKAPDDASRRLARNTQIIMKHEALLSLVADAGAGSYYLESITDFLAREGWKAMQKIERGGGYRKSVEDGTVAGVIAPSIAARKKEVANRRRVLTGSNQFADSAERVLDRIDLLRLASRHRGAEGFEALRMRTERHAAKTGRSPRVLLAEFGDVKMRSARSAFASNFIACGGFDVVMQQISTAEEIIRFGADLIVLCSSDAEYLDMATDVAHGLRDLGSKLPLLVAGNPESAEQLRAAGVAGFIHIRSNPIEVLAAWQQRLGIESE